MDIVIVLLSPPRKQSLNALPDRESWVKWRLEISGNQDLSNCALCRHVENCFYGIFRSDFKVL